MVDRYILENKAGYIADSTISSYLSHDAEKVSLYPVIDHISLLFQRPLDINIATVMSGRPHIVFSNSWSQAAVADALKIMNDSVRRPHCAKLKNPKKWLNDHVLVLVRNIVGTPHREGYECAFLSETDQRGLEAYLSSLEEDLSPALYSIFEKTVPRIQDSRPVNALSRHEETQRLDGSEIARLTARLSAELDFLYQSISMAQSRMHAVAKKPIGNVFCAIRYVSQDTKIRQGRFPYSAQVVLSKSQAKAVDEVKEYVTAASRFRIPPSVLLQQPLSEEARSISDAIFQSGIIEFPPETFGEGRDSSRLSNGQASQDGARRSLEAQFLRGFGTRLMHVPIHVGGVPWAVFFMVVPDADPDETWLRIARFYRACVPLLGDGLRRIVRRQFLDALSLVFETELKAFLTSKGAIEVTIASINAKVEALCGFFPYGAPVFTSKRMTSQIKIDVDRDGQPYQIRVTTDADSPFLCFAGSLSHDRLNASQHELRECLVAALARAKASLDTAKAARAAFASALAHDVKNSTNEIIGRLDAPLNVFRLTEIGERYKVAAANLVRANIRAMMLNSIAMSINTLFMEADPAEKLGKRIFPRKDVEQFWESVLRLLLEMRALKEDDRNPDDSRRFRLIVAPSLKALAEFHDGIVQSMPETITYPKDWQIAPQTDLNTLLKKAMVALQHRGSMREGLTDYRLGIAFAMLTETVSNIRFNRSVPNVPHARDMIIAYEFRWNGDYPDVYLQQVHWEAAKTGWKPPKEIPQGIGRTLSLFGPKSSALNFMTIDISNDPLSRQGIQIPDGAAGQLCAYGLRLGLKLLRAQ